MSHATAPRSRIPVIGVLSPISRILILATFALSLVAAVLDLVLHVEGAIVFIVAAAAILGLAWIVGLSTERLGALTGPQVGASSTRPSATSPS